MTDTFKSGQWRICSGCLIAIRPKDRVCILYDEIHCMDCLSDDESDAFNDLTNDGINEHITVVSPETYDEMTKE